MLGAWPHVLRCLLLTPPPRCSAPPQELCLLTKHLQAAQRNSLLLRLVGLGLFQVRSLGVRAASGRAASGWDDGRCDTPIPNVHCCALSLADLPIPPRHCCFRPLPPPHTQVITTVMSVGASAVKQRATGE